MCLILFAYRVHPRYELVLAANRDEFYHRPTAPMAFWQDAPELLAGRDLQAGGTWLGLNRKGRFAAVTNYRDPRSARTSAVSRGLLISDFLQTPLSAWDYLAQLASRSDEYSGFNLLLWDLGNLYYYANQNGSPQQLEPGLYGLSNHLLDTPWPKVEKGRQGLARLLKEPNGLEPEDLLNLLEDRILASDAELPVTGMGLEWERLLSPMFIESSEYGTRCSTVLLIEQDEAVRVLEKTWDDGGVREFCLG